jgi:transglutaminase/protease-like cytokinesis protein 3
MSQREQDKNYDNDKPHLSNSQMEGIVRKIPDEINSINDKDIDIYADDIVMYLIDGVDNDFAKVKLIHDWIADNIKYDMKTAHSIDLANMGWAPTNLTNHEMYDEVLKRGKAVCAGYSMLFIRMCEIADIEAIYISGISTRKSYSKDKHAWNAVKINDKWYMMDITWDSGYVSAGKYVKSYSADYLLVKPEHFIYTHFPDEVEHQFLENPITKDEFFSLPCYNGGFFDYGIEIDPSIKSKIDITSEERFVLKCNNNISIDAILSSDLGNDFDNGTFIQKMGSKYLLSVNPPMTGKYSLKIYAKTENRKSYTSVADIPLECYNKVKNDYPYPKVYTKFNDINAFLFSPFSGQLQRNRQVSFKIYVPNAVKVALFIDYLSTYTTVHLKKGDKYVFFLNDYLIPKSNMISIAAKFDENSDNYDYLLSYKILS